MSHWGNAEHDDRRRHYVPDGPPPAEARTACGELYSAQITGDVSTNVQGTAGVELCPACLAAYDRDHDG